MVIGKTSSGWNVDLIYDMTKLKLVCGYKRRELHKVKIMVTKDGYIMMED